MQIVQDITTAAIGGSTALLTSHVLQRMKPARSQPITGAVVTTNGTTISPTAEADLQQSQDLKQYADALYRASKSGDGGGVDWSSVSSAGQTGVAFARSGLEVLQSHRASSPLGTRVLGLCQRGIKVTLLPFQWCNFYGEGANGLVTPSLQCLWKP